jgi:hypothetical protein
MRQRGSGGVQRIADLIKLGYPADQWGKGLAIPQSLCCNSQGSNRSPDRPGHPPSKSQAHEKASGAASEGDPSRSPKGRVDELFR